MKKQYYVLNGPNMNLLGTREPEHYGTDSYRDLKKAVKEAAKRLGVRVKIMQTNHEGKLVDMIHKAYRAHVNGIVINPAAYTHTSIAIYDALKATGIPAVEVHISDIENREDFRKVSYVGLAAEKTISGQGISGYTAALEYLAKT